MCQFVNVRTKYYNILITKSDLKKEITVITVDSSKTNTK